MYLNIMFLCNNITIAYSYIITQAINNKFTTTDYNILYTDKVMKASLYYFTNILYKNRLLVYLPIKFL